LATPPVMVKPSRIAVASVLAAVTTWSELSNCSGLVASSALTSPERTVGFAAMLRWERSVSLPKKPP
jgi:hypothetical protein